MVQVSIGRSIAQAYGFLFRRILTVIGLSWVAAAFFIVLRKALLGLGPVPHNLVTHWPQALAHLGGLIAAVLLLCAIAVPLTRAALDEAMEWSVAHFVIGVRELRLFVALVLLYLIVVAVAVVSALAVAGAAMGTKMALAHWPVLASAGLPVTAIAVGIVAVVISVATIYIAVRLSFLLYAIAAAEPHASLWRSWALAKGNVLRMFVISLAIVVPVCVLFAAADYALMGQSLIETLRSVFATRPVDQAPLYALLAAHGWGVAAIAGAIVVVSTALQGAAAGAAYRGLLGLDRAAAEDATAVEEIVMIEEVAETPAEHHDDHGQDPVAQAADAHHDASADAAHDESAVEEAHAEETHGDDHGDVVAQDEAAHHDAPAEEATGEHGGDTPEGGAEVSHAEEAPAAEHGEDHAAAHDAPADEAQASHDAVEHAAVHAAAAPDEEVHDEEAHGEDGGTAEIHGEEVHGAEEIHGEEAHAEALSADDTAPADAAHTDEAPREVEHA